MKDDDAAGGDGSRDGKGTGCGFGDGFTFTICGNIGLAAGWKPIFGWIDGEIDRLGFIPDIDDEERQLAFRGLPHSGVKQGDLFRNLSD